jgi:hypothetical protein
MKYLLFIFILFSCNGNKIVGNWNFIKVYKGEIKSIDSLSIINNSQYGSGKLNFYKDFYEYP